MPPTGDEFSGPLSVYQAIVIAKGCLMLLLIDPVPEVMEQIQSFKNLYYYFFRQVKIGAYLQVYFHQLFSSLSGS